MKKINVKVVHSESKSAWNIVNTVPGGKFKIARVPYIVSYVKEIDSKNRMEALEHANFIADCFNNKAVFEK